MTRADYLFRQPYPVYKIIDFVMAMGREAKRLCARRAALDPHGVDLRSDGGSRAVKAHRCASWHGGVGKFAVLGFCRSRLCAGFFADKLRSEWQQCRLKTQGQSGWALIAAQSGYSDCSVSV